MAKFTYIGTDDPTDNQVCTVYGLRFVVGQAVEVSDPVIAGKLAGNPTFKATGKAKSPAAAETGAETDTAGAENDQAEA